MFKKELFVKTFLIIILLNILSFLAYQSEVINLLSFIFILIVTALLAWRNLFYGVLILLGELMISSQGHLFDLKIYSFVFSLRMGIFAVVLITALAQFLISNFKFLIKSQYLISNIQYLIKHYKLYLLLALFVAWGIINGLIQGNNLGFLYQDVNGYLFFLLLPIFVITFAKMNNQNQITNYQSLITIWTAAIIWQFFISVSLLFFYGHLDVFWRQLEPIYTWFRDQRMIEVGLYKYNFYRVFMQSQIYVLFGFFIFLSNWLFSLKKHPLLHCSIASLFNKCKRKKNNNRTIEQYNNNHFAQKKTLRIDFVLVAVITILIISLSRSFWIAGLITFILFIVFYLYIQKPKIKILFYQSTHFLFITLISLMIIAGALLAPIGKVPGLKTLSSLPERATESQEPALTSRWELLPILWNNVRTNFLFGKGFGSTITYKTSDPRYLQAHPDNPYYTTFAFEWGWLDIWYKIGFFGLLTYLFLIGSVIYRGILNLESQISNITIGLMFGLIALTMVHFFTPFLNHPLGIGYLLLTDAVFRASRK